MRGCATGCLANWSRGRSKSLTLGRKPPAWFGSFPIVGSICIVVLSLFHLKRPPNWGLSDHKAWEDYIDRHILTLAKFNGIRVQDLQWVAAHHNEKGHPHIHVVFWNKHQRTMVPLSIQASRIKSENNSFEIPLPSVSKSIARPNSGQRNTCRPSQTK